MKKQENKNSERWYKSDNFILSVFFVVMILVIFANAWLHECVWK